MKDVSWSGVFQQQIDGRAWRYGQKEEVLVYHMVALGTTDVTMSSMAGEKMLFLGALTKQAKDHLLENVLQEMEEDELQRKFPDSDLGEDEDEDEDNDNDDNEDSISRPQAASKTGKAAERKKGRRKRQADPETEEGGRQGQSSQGNRKERQQKGKQGKKRKATAKPVDVVETSNEGDDNKKPAGRNKGKAKAPDTDDDMKSTDEFPKVGDEMTHLVNQPNLYTQNRNQTAAEGPAEDIAGIGMSTSSVPTAAPVAFQATDMSTAERLQGISLGTNTTTKSKRKADSMVKDHLETIKKKRLLSPAQDIRMSSPPLATSSACTAGPSSYVHGQSQETIDAFPISSRASSLSLFSGDEDDEKYFQIDQTQQYTPAPRPQARPQPPQARPQPPQARPQPPQARPQPPASLPLESCTLGQQHGRSLTQEQAAYQPQTFSFRGTSRHQRGPARGTFKG
jgi:hypothetical protein